MPPTPSCARPRTPGAWEAIVGAYPLIAHWIDAEPITDIQLMAKIEDRHRSFVIDGTPVATGIAAVADSWACTNPSVGRGATIGLIHAQALRDHVRDHGLDDPVSFATTWHDVTMDKVEPLFQDTLDFDRHRLAEIDAQIAGLSYEPDDDHWKIGQAMAAAAGADPDLLRAFVDIISLNERAEQVLARPGIFDRVLEHASIPPEASPGPSRTELLDLTRSDPNPEALHDIFTAEVGLLHGRFRRSRCRAPRPRPRSAGEIPCA